MHLSRTCIGVADPKQANQLRLVTGRAHLRTRPHPGSDIFGFMGYVDHQLEASHFPGLNRAASVNSPAAPGVTPGGAPTPLKPCRHQTAFNTEPL